MHPLLHNQPFNAAWPWSSLADVATAMAAGLDWTLLTDLTQGRVKGASNFRGRWTLGVHMWPCFQLWRLLPFVCVCVREAAPVSIFMRLWQGGRGGKRQKPRELAVKVSKYTKRRRVPRRDGTLRFCGGEKRQRGNRTWCNGSVSPLSMFWLTYWMQEIRNRPQMSASLNLTS